MMMNKQPQRRGDTEKGDRERDIQCSASALSWWSVRLLTRRLLVHSMILSSVSLCLCGAALAMATQTLDDFGFAVPIATSGDDALQRVAIPQSVYEAAAFADLRDLRVFNGAGELVPYAFRPVDRMVEKPPAVALPIFPLRGPRDARAEDLDLSFHQSGDKVSLQLRSRAASPGREALLGYLIDVSATKVPLSRIEVDWGTPAVDRIVSARLEAGEDLKHWSALASDAPLGGLSHAGQRLERKVIEFAPRRAKYLRLLWTDPAQALEIRAVSGAPPETSSQPPRLWKQVAAAPVTGKPGDYEFDLGGLFPLDRLAFALPQENTVVQAQIFSRAKSEDNWMPVANVIVYRLQQGGRELTSPEVAVGMNSHRHWMLRVDAASGGIGSGALIVRAGWTPREIVFAARGAGLFRIAFGNSKAQPGSLNIETLVPGWRTDQEPNMPVASTGALETLAGEAAAQQRINWKKWGLWAALVAGVAVLAWMAWRLMKQMQPPGTK